MDRRRFATATGAALLAGASLPCRGVRATPTPTLRFGVTAVFLNNRLRTLARWKSYLESATGTRVEYVQRGTYSPIIDGLRSGQIDIAWICGYPYVLHAAEFRLLAVPVWRARPVYQSYLIARADNGITGLPDLKGRSFAFSDPLSNSGYLYVRYVLAQQGQRVETYFGRSFFAHSHLNVIEAVAEALADGGAVDGYVWEVLAEISPALTARTRVLQRSPEFGFPPLVAAAHVAAPVRALVQHALWTMHESAEGRAVLAELRLDRMERAVAQQYDAVAQMARAVA